LDLDNKVLINYEDDDIADQEEDEVIEED